MGASQRGADKDAPSRSQGNPPSPIVIPSSPAVEVVTLKEDYASGDKGRAVSVPSLVCRRQIDFIDEPYVPKASRLPVQEELQQTEAAVEIPPSTSHRLFFRSLF